MPVASGFHLGNELEIRRVVGVTAAGLQAGTFHGRLEVQFVRRTSGDRGRRETVLESPGADDTGPVDAERSFVERAGLHRLGSVQRVVDGGSFRPAGKRHLRLVREQDQVALDGRRTDKRLRGERIGHRQVFPLRDGLRGKLERQHAATHDFVIGEPVPVHRFSVQLHAGDVGSAGVVRPDGQGLAIRQPDDGLAEERCRQDILAGARADGIQAQRSQYIPGPHLAAVLIAADAAGIGGIGFRQDHAHELLGLGRSAGPAEQPREVVVRLVAVGILADDSANVRIQDALAGRLVGEEGIQRVPERFLPAQQRGHARHVMRDEEAVLPRGRLGVIPGTGQRVEGRGPGPIGVLSAHETA